ncbi:MAG: hypothetical protein NTV44_04905 [Firmicutes bacterium]|nr:hypothetical protein [Bacillota bacterium]
MAIGRQKGSVNRKYSPKFKVQVVEDKLKNNLGYNETCIKYGLVRPNGKGNLTAFTTWERIYLEEGPQGLSIERRGRGKNQGRKMKAMSPSVKKDLIAKVQRLEMENEYLKKLDALVRKRERNGKKSPK